MSCGSSSWFAILHSTELRVINLAGSCMHEEDGSVTIRDDLDALLQVRRLHICRLYHYNDACKQMCYMRTRHEALTPLRSCLETSEIHWASIQTEHIF